MRSDQLTLRQCSILLALDSNVRLLCKNWYDGQISDLFTWDGRYTRRRLVCRAIRELSKSSYISYWEAFLVWEDSSKVLFKYPATSPLVPTV